jgi:hypothetical protein
LCDLGEEGCESGLRLKFMVGIRVVFCHGGARGCPIQKGSAAWLCALVGVFEQLRLKIVLCYLLELGEAWQQRRVSTDVYNVVVL